MARMIIADNVINVDIPGAVFESIEGSLPEDNPDCREVVSSVRPLIDRDLYFDLEMAVNTLVAEALEQGFRIGWELRGKA
jgi:hypothetical protein